MATAKKRSNIELCKKIVDDVNIQQESVMTSQSIESFSPNQIQEKRFSYETRSTKEDKNSEKSDTSSNDSCQTFYDNHHGGLSMATNKQIPSIRWKTCTRVVLSNMEWITTHWVSPCFEGNNVFIRGFLVNKTHSELRPMYCYYLRCKVY